MSVTIESHHPILKACAAVIALALSLSSPALAQETRATVTGTVKDAQGAVVPGVTVTVVNTDTGVTTEDVTNEAGVFNIQKLQPAVAGLRMDAAASRLRSHGGEESTTRNQNNRCGFVAPSRSSSADSTPIRTSTG